MGCAAPPDGYGLGGGYAGRVAPGPGYGCSVCAGSGVAGALVGRAAVDVGVAVLLGLGTWVMTGPAGKVAVGAISVGATAVGVTTTMAGARVGVGVGCAGVHAATAIANAPSP